MDEGLLAVKDRRVSVVGVIARVDAKGLQIDGYPVRTLQAWRYRGGGPKFVKTSRSIRYRRSDLIAWMEAATRENTSQGGGHG